MRENLLIGIIVILALLALVRPRIGLFGYLWCALMRPDILTWSGPAPYSNILAITTVIGTLRYIVDVPLLLRNRIVAWFLLLQIPFVLSVLFAVFPELTYREYNLHLKIALMALLIPLHVRTCKDLKVLLAVLGLSIGAIGFKFGLWGLVHGGTRYTAGFGSNSMLSDNNTLALALAMAVPMLWYLREFFTSRWIQIALWGFLLCTTAAIIMTHSRGGAISLAVAFAMIAARSRRKVALIVLFAALSAPAIYLVRSSYLARIGTIADYTTESSAVSRLALAQAAVRMWWDHPMLGVGFGSLNFRMLVKEYASSESLVAHNTYLQVLADSGVFAFLLYSGLLLGTIRWLGRSAARMREEQPGQEVYPWAIQGALATFAVGSLFLSRVGFDYWYMLLMAAAAWWQIQRNLTADEQAS